MFFKKCTRFLILSSEAVLHSHSVLKQSVLAFVSLRKAPPALIGRLTLKAGRVSRAVFSVGERSSRQCGLWTF